MSLSLCFLILHQNVPHISHFFYIGRIFESQYFTLKITKTPKNYKKIAPKKCQICGFRIQSGKFYTGQIFFTQAPPVVPVTNMRYASKKRKTISDFIHMMGSNDSTRC